MSQDIKYLCTADGGYYNEPCEIVCHTAHKGRHYQVVTVRDNLIVVPNEEVHDSEQA